MHAHVRAALPTPVVIGLGSNLGQRHSWIHAALVQLQAVPGLRLRSVSPLYETDPVGGPAQPRYLNAAAWADVALDPLDLLRHTQGIENALGRQRQQRWGPRTIDLDLLWMAGTTAALPELTLPHPRLWEREFAFVPLRDVLPPEFLSATERSRLRAAQLQPLGRLNSAGDLQVVQRGALVPSQEPVFVSASTSMGTRS